MDDMNFELESDMKAAKMLGKCAKYSQLCNAVMVPIRGDKQICTELFTLKNAATRDAVVQMLGKKHGCSIVWIAGNDAFSWFFMFSARDSNGVGYKTYEEALRHAVMGVKDE